MAKMIYENFQLWTSGPDILWWW